MSSGRYLSLWYNVTDSARIRLLEDEANLSKEDRRDMVSCYLEIGGYVPENRV